MYWPQVIKRAVLKRSSSSKPQPARKNAMAVMDRYYGELATKSAKEQRNEAALVRKTETENSRQICHGQDD